MPRMPKELSRAYARRACRIWPPAPPDRHRRTMSARLPARSGAKAGDVVGLFISIVDHDIAVLDKATRAQALRNENMCCKSELSRRSASAELRTLHHARRDRLLAENFTPSARPKGICAAHS